MVDACAKHFLGLFSFGSNAKVWGVFSGAGCASWGAHRGRDAQIQVGALSIVGWSILFGILDSLSGC